MMAVHVLRAGLEGDRAYVLDAWIRGYRSSDFGLRLPPDVYYSRFGHSGLVEHLLDSGDLTVACMHDSPDFILGFAVSRPGLLHYVCVKQDFRRSGVGRTLLDSCCREEAIRTTHVTKDFQLLAGARPIEFVNPYKNTQRKSQIHDDHRVRIQRAGQDSQDAVRNR